MALINIAAWWLPHANGYMPLQHKADMICEMLSLTAPSPDCLARRLPLKHDRCSEDCGPPATFGVASYLSCELVVGCPSVHWGLTRAPQRGTDDLSVVVTLAKVLILKDCA